MIARIWRGAVRTEDRDAYVRYLDETGIPAYKSVEGNRGAWTLTRDLGDGRTEIVTLSFWDSYGAIEGFAGSQIERAVFYPEDDRYLIERDETVTHYQMA